ncbi:inositol 2-dehydrogenase [Halomonas elongata]|uniref:Inositol 2-dehydrogenase n=1 Tax=Halomonas elongata (strain ATCC 33173 / DSM 2581 / NBRC 15536 / NCIMB 2198 / 1H9) TaxID=768066 RepID=E1VBG6_HALED|nr:inositol 2-dehydrogenase [Halomonas elongata]MBW5801881.1 inositol 2-dehydrogenase [Halomonas elongata]MDL4862135.1 inositol 2-dehydrogenase [Halomonas elongata]WBF17890.1 inositol 2-dehydrogenase [Halomonas elongata]WPU46736.1 inositol 2-dehydrogenase [Halomonas elongata DSM 2581]WVI71455.1 inositol 2-dehydrogenase [Halomonas elongata]
MRLALIGAGRIGKVHARAIDEHPEVTLAAVADFHAPAAEALAAEYGARTLDADTVFEDDEIDAVLIASSTPTHADYLERAARAGKAVLCEKPIALDLARTVEALRVLESHPVTCALGFNRRHDPQFAALKRAVMEGRIGNLETLTIISRDPAPPPTEYIGASGGIFRDMTIHDFDMARWLLNEPIAEVHAEGSCLIDPGIGAAGDVDTAMVTLITNSGRLCHISNSRRACYGYDQRIEAFGSAGMLQAQNESDTRLRFTGEPGQVEGKPKWFFLERYAEAYRHEIDDFVDAWKQQRAPLAGADDGLQALRLAEAAERSRHEGRRITLDEID